MPHHFLKGWPVSKLTALTENRYKCLYCFYGNNIIGRQFLHSLLKVDIVPLLSCPPLNMRPMSYGLSLIGRDVAVCKGGV